MSNNEETSFWKFLDNNKIVIPIFQRDYAQGRKGLEYVREAFIISIIKHINDGTVLKFDFVYGTQKDNIFEPLDGQQRLTSLWLLHFYILYKKNQKLSDEEKAKLSKFTYLTRDSSKDFCHELINKTIEGPAEEKLTYLIQNQLWYFKEWGGDPTIKAMLNMLDSIEDKFNNLDNSEDFINKAYEHLFNKDDIIRFYVLYLNNIKTPEDLYIKMNARGKPLTNFENFKSDFTEYLRKKKITSQDEINKKLDTKWSDLFWPYRYKKEYIDKTKDNKNVSIDDNYYSFINRIIFCLLTEYYNKESDDNKKSDENEKFFDKAKALLYEEKDSKNRYKSFDIYEKILDGSPDAITRIEKIFDHIVEFSNQNSFIINMYNPYKENNSNENPTYTDIFIPQWEKKEIAATKETYYELSLIEQQHYPVFYGVILYLIKNDSYNEKSFEAWMRFVWNFCLSPDLDTFEDTINVMKLLKIISKYSSDITSNLSNPDIYKSLIDDKKVGILSTQFINNQFNEEVIKALLIKNKPEFEETIREMEEYAFFNGSIEFLFDYKEVTEVNINDKFFEDIKKRFNIVKELFEKNNDNKKVFKTGEDYLNECRSFIVGVILKLSKKRDYFQQKSIFDYENNVTVWKTILHEPDCKNAIKEIFKFLKDKKLSEIQPSDYDQEFAKIDFEPKLLKNKIDISVSKMTNDLSLIRYIINNLHNYQFKPYYNAYKIVLDNQHSTNKDKQYIIVDSDSYFRNELADSLEDKSNDDYIVIDENLKIKDCKGYYTAFVLTFTYKDYKFKWESLVSPTNKKDKITILSKCCNESGKSENLLDNRPSSKDMEMFIDYRKNDLSLVRSNVINDSNSDVINDLKNLIEKKIKRNNL